ncbi:helix-turn-helix domain-containing protein [Bosea sp. PAMC 26642]|uniref:helix-turn-helix domain-containing protein n=1 Tax=Bosea sp. (strain PAMC 26642) TaxID=1792307 RepID=UPI001F15ABBC|nr:helix-turn-helix transcriptional regulator [Bosea sp. PAMC 26642]
MSQEELAARSELHRTNVSKLERSLHALSIDNLYWVAKALGVGPEHLLRDRSSWPEDAVDKPSGSRRSN